MSFLVTTVKGHHMFIILILLLYLFDLILNV
jgi:hypothetical protein